MRAQAVASALDIERTEIEAAARNGGRPQTHAEQLSTIKSLADNARKQEEQEHKDRQAAIVAQANDNLDKAKTEDERLQALKTYHQLTEDEYVRHQLALGKIGDDEQQQKAELSPLKELRDELDKLKQETDFTPAQLAGQAVGKLFSSLKTNVLSSIDAIVTGSKTLKQALGDMGRQILVELASWLAKKAVLKGAEEMAEGFSDLANPFMAWHAPQHFYAAAGWFALAGAAAIGGRLIAGAGGGGATSGASGGQAVASSGTTDRTIREGRTGGASDPNVIEQSRNALAPRPIIIHLEAHAVTTNEPGTLTNHVLRVVSDDPRAKVAVVEHVGQELGRAGSRLHQPFENAFVATYRSNGPVRDTVKNSPWE
jgi:hypothetical protein